MREYYFTKEELGVLFNDLHELNFVFGLGSNKCTVATETTKCFISSIKDSYLKEELMMNKLSGYHRMYYNDPITKHAEEIKNNILKLVELLHCGLSQVPLYINYSEPLETVAKWRLRIGK
jgi:hypothetical protein